MKKQLTPKRRTKTYSDKRELRVALVQHCEKEYEEKFGHPWSADQLARVEDLVRRWQVDDDAWRVLNKFRKAAAEALNFFESRGLSPHRPDNGLYYAHMLHGLLRKRRRFLEALVNEVREEYERAPEKRHWLA